MLGLSYIKDIDVLRSEITDYINSTNGIRIKSNSNIEIERGIEEIFKSHIPKLDWNKFSIVVNIDGNNATISPCNDFSREILTIGQPCT